MMFCILYHTSNYVVGRYFFPALLCLVFASCNGVPGPVMKVLDKAGDNRTELERVIAYYQEEGDKEKLEAAYYLIGNMMDKNYWGGALVRDFDAIFHILDSLHKRKITVPNPSPLLEVKWDSLVNEYGFPRTTNAELLRDYEELTADYLITHIDQAFKLWRENKWGHGLPFQQFLEYLLPYRIGKERPELWITALGVNFQEGDSIQSRLQFAEALYKQLVPQVNSNRIFLNYPFDIPASLMQMGKNGVCRNHVIYTAMVMRANGLPVAVDFTPLWGNRNGAHFWNVLKLENGDEFPFEAPGGLPFHNFGRPHQTLAKVFRSSFQIRSPPIDDPILEEIPADLLQSDRIDVTHMYTKTFDIEVPLVTNSRDRQRFAVICSFNNSDWQAQDWGRIQGEKVKFKNMGSSVMYLVMYYKDGKYYPANEPFVLKDDGHLAFIHPKGFQDMVLKRKFPLFPWTAKHHKLTMGSKIQGANRPDFQDSVTLLTVTQFPENFVEVEINCDKTFNYVRLIPGKGQYCSIAELEFYGGQRDVDTKLEGSIIGFPEEAKAYGTPYSHAFDGDLETYFSGHPYRDSWVGMSFKKPQRINRIRYAPRSDTNFILIGDLYELCIWKEGTWVSIGKITATDQKLVFRHVPANGLYLLHNLTKGREERIFTYENGKQVWW